MADVKMPESIPCQFDKRGWSPCKRPSNNGWCTKHENLKCVSCGGKATHGCDRGMGGLVCGSPLCDMCQHSMEDHNHVTLEVYNKQLDERRLFDETGQETAVMLAKRGLPTGLPKNIKEILDGDRTGWQSQRCWSLQLKHSLMGYFPVIVKDTGVILITSDRKAILRVWKSLKPKTSQIDVLECMVNTAGTVAYVMAHGDYDKTRSLPLKLFSVAEIDELFQKDKEAFEWAPGLMGACISQENFERLINNTEQSLVA